MRRVFPVLLSIFFLGSAAVAQAQQVTPNDIMGMFGTMMNAANGDAHRQQARDAWAQANPDLVACLQQQYQLYPQRLAAQGIGPYDRRISAQLNQCNQSIAARQQRNLQSQDERRQGARDAWAQIDPDIAACFDRTNGTSSQQLAEQGIGPRDRRAAVTIERCGRSIVTERTKAEQRRAERDAQIQKRKEEAERKTAELHEKKAAADRLAAENKAAADRLAAEEKQRKERRAKIATDPKLAFLGAGAPEDLIVTVNIGPKAPHAVVDLHGHLAFTDNAAIICFADKVELTPVETRLFNENLAAIKIAPGKLQTALCTGDGALDSVDMLVLRRAAIFQGSFSGRDALMGGLARDSYIKGFVITVDDVKATQEKHEVELGALENGIEKGTRKGYGVIAIPNDGRLFCNTAAELAKIFPELSRDLITAKDFQKIDPASLQIAEVDTDTAFISIKKDKCRAVFGNAANLRILMAGLKRDHVAYSLDGRWISDETIAAYEQGKSQQEKKHLQDEAEAKERLAADRELTERRAEETGKAKADRQQALRAANGARVTALKDAYVKDTQAFVQSTRQTVASAYLAKLLPELGLWYQDRLSEGWELAASSVDVVDYGGSVWKGRKLEAFLVTSTIRIRHRELGEYRQFCYVGAYIDDVEFGMARAPLFATCDQAKDAVGRWKDSFDFTSKWNAE